MEPNESESKEIQTVESTALESITKGEIDIQISTAKAHPRSIEKFRKKALGMATIDVETAASCFYKLKRHDKRGVAKFIEGPSIRLAEIVNSCWGNIRTGARIIQETDRYVVAQGVSHDLEHNNISVVEVRRKITTRDGKKFNDDMVGVTMNAAIAIAYRNACFKNIPRSYINRIFLSAKQVAVGESTTTGELRQQWFEAFTKMGVDEKQILDYLEVPSIEDVGIKDIETLIGVHNAIKDGDTTIDDQFGPEKKEKPRALKTEKEKNDKDETESSIKKEYEDLMVAIEHKPGAKKKWLKLYEAYLTEERIEPLFLEDRHYKDLIQIIKRDVLDK